MLIGQDTTPGTKKSLVEGAGFCVRLLVLGRILVEFSQIQHSAGEEKFSVSFSAGISGYPLLDEVMPIMISADDAMYRAKDAGRNQIVVASTAD